MRSELFENMPVGRLFAYCVLPGAVSMAVSALYVVVDGMFVGHYMGHESLAAANMMWPLLGVVFALAGMIGMGSSVQIAKFLGQRHHLRANRTFSFGVSLALALGVLMSVAGFVLTGPFLRLMGADDATIALSTSYVRSYLIFGPLVCLYFDVNSYLRICGLQKYSMYLGIFTSILNLILDYVFIVMLRQGIWSASFTTCLSMSIGAVMGIWPFVRGRTDLKFNFGFISKKQFVKLLMNGFPGFLEQSTFSFMMLIVNTKLLAFGGTAAVAANAAVMYIGSVVMMLLDGMIGALQPPLSYCYGARLMPRVSSIERWLLWVTGGFSLVVFILLETVGPYLIPLYAKTGDREFIELGELCILLLSFRYLFAWLEMALRGFLTALESPGRAFLLSVCNTFVFPVGFILLLSEIWQLKGIWLAPGVAAVFSGVLAVILSLGMWRQKSQAMQC